MYRNASYTPRRFDGQNRTFARRPVAPMPTTPPTSPQWTMFAESQPNRAAWIVAKAPTFEFAAAMMQAVGRFGDLTDNQAAAVDRCILRDARRDEAPARVQVLNDSVRTLTNIRAAFDTLIANGGRKPITIGDITISVAPASGRNAGALYVKHLGQYAGKIVGTAFYAARDAGPAVWSLLIEIENDPRAAVQAHAARIAAQIAQAALEGRTLSMPCGCCGLTLTDPVSIARGIGPICAGRWGF